MVPVQEVTTAGGIRAFLVTERAVPFLSLGFHFRGGARLDPPDGEGLAAFAGAVIDEGAGPYDSQAYRRELEDNVIRLGFDVDRTGFSGHLKTLTATRDHAFELLRLALVEARLDEEPVERVRAQLQADLARRAKEPNAQARRHFFKGMFGSHPYGRSIRGTPETVAGFSADDVRRYVSQNLRRDDLVVGVCGDIDAQTLAPLLDHVFGGLPAGSVWTREQDVPLAGPGLAIVEMDNPQTVAMFGHGGIARHDPEYHAAYIANHILAGGGFSSRLMEEVREKRGLAYGVSASLVELEGAPLWLGQVATSNDRVAQSLEIIAEEAGKLARGMLESPELEDARTYLTGSFPLRLTSNDQVAGMLTGMLMLGLGADFLERRNQLIEAVTLADVQAAAARLLHPEAMRVVAVGRPQGLVATS
ncbi:MAG TPA: pitrilysin family protein [Geminicoccus sp.]|uniref:M16 family metallopeptidase n=1 Tax=Geminicoccus sp. TaxID=2024832 RepID=UPI002CE84F84|nr:pitrilysin family protein [Geminicoccus sp.]HWL68581.1 pitrilysin family protein [Geminicoccus sp.]